MSGAAIAQETPWHAAFPSPKIVATTITRDEVLQMITKNATGTNPLDFVLVDLRRADHEGGTISGSLNLPAQSLYPSIPTLYAVLKQGGIKKVIWYCGSSAGRGTRAGGWFADYLHDVKKGETGMESLVLVGGIKGWVKAGEEYITQMDGYDANVWKNL
ncbi:hypothetical protein FQN57_000836 [Myotisia sp. PD_48]|nr:hypothetical protein FQN57_000836 [Myotisia sp. PD_48]